MGEEYEIQVGDRIIQESCFGKITYTVHRVTKLYALVRCNDVYEQKFKRVCYGNDVEPVPYEKWRTVGYFLVKKGTA